MPPAAGTRCRQEDASFDFLDTTPFFLPLTCSHASHSCKRPFQIYKNPKQTLKSSLISTAVGHNLNLPSQKTLRNTYERIHTTQNSGNAPHYHLSNSQLLKQMEFCVNDFFLGKKKRIQWEVNIYLTLFACISHTDCLWLN